MFPRYLRWEMMGYGESSVSFTVIVSRGVERGGGSETYGRFGDEGEDAASTCLSPVFVVTLIKSFHC